MYKSRLVITKDYEEMSSKAAELIAREIRKNPRCVLGLPTGNTPLGLYRNFIKMYKKNELSFSFVKTFNLDEYYGLPPNHPLSYHFYMYRNFFDHIDIDKRNIHIPDGLTKNPIKHCREYEEKIREAGGIDWQILGIGRNGHIGFNEPGSELDSRTRLVDLTEQTIMDNSRYFEKIEDVPRKAITIGIATIMEAKNILLLASGEHKADIIHKAFEGPVTKEVPASFLQYHPRVTLIIDKLAASKLKSLIVELY